MNNTLIPSKHFLWRSAQLQLSPSDLAFVLEHGRLLHRTGILFRFLGRKDIPKKLRREPTISRLEGVTLLLSSEGTVITAYKNPQGLQQIRRKPKHRWLAYPARRPERATRSL